MISDFLCRDSIYLWETGNQRRSNINPKKNGENSSLALKCFECDQPGHLRFDCPVFKRIMKKSDKRNFKEKKEKKYEEKRGDEEWK